MSFGIIGAGIVGLTTALELQREFPNAQISILADKFVENTTSDVAAGLFRPAVTFSGPSPQITMKWLYDAYNYWDEIRQSVDAPIAGVCQLSGYIFSRLDPNFTKNHLMEKIVRKYRKATEDELTLCNGDWKYGSFFTTVLTECNLFLPYAMEKFKRLGGTILQERINSFNELHRRFDVVINCTGLGSRQLCYDYKLLPIRGQIVKVKAPWIKMAFYGESNDTYIIPGFRGVTLGGCYEYGNFDMSPCKYRTQAILEKCHRMLPNLQESEFLCERVGLRPHRDIVRVENEIFYTGVGTKLKIVHNYGHGGYGVTTAPGTAKHAVKLVQEVLSATYINKL